ncbi:MAG: hypothetical protein LBB12_04635 [Holosporaceae bacterium]|jgi:NADH-quinone oxidoreductase subunit N|nr:hypothetical protein [Holosporaceae bacterium]
MIGNFLPEFFILCYGICVYGLKRFYAKEIDWPYGLLLAALLCFIGGDGSSGKLHFFEHRPYESLLKFTLLLMAFLLRYFERENIFKRRLLIMASVLGCLLTFSSCNLVALLFSLELSVIPIYFLLWSDVEENNVASHMKTDTMNLATKIPEKAMHTRFLFFIYGITSTIIFAVSIGIMYASTGFSNFNDIRYIFSFLSKQDNLALIASALMLLSFCIKIGVFLCHWWMFEALVGKASTALLIVCILRFSLAIGFYKLLTSVLYYIDISEIIVLLACVSIIFAAILLIFQNDLRKILAYLSACHAGILLLCCACKTYTSMRSLIYILLSDIISVSGIFMFLTAIRKNRSGDLKSLQDLYCLSRWSARTAISLSVLWASMFGLLPLIGFWGKYYLCLALLEKHFIFSAVAVVFFLLAGLICAAKILNAIWFKESQKKLLFVVDNNTLMKFFNLIPYFTIVAIPFAQKIAYLMRADLYFIR